MQSRRPTLGNWRYDFVPIFNANITAQTNQPNVNVVTKNRRLALFGHVCQTTFTCIDALMVFPAIAGRSTTSSATSCSRTFLSIHPDPEMWSETVDLRTRPVSNQNIGLGLGFAGLVLCCETRSCYARRHNDLEGRSNFTISIFGAWNITTVEINSGVYLY